MDRRTELHFALLDTFEAAKELVRLWAEEDMPNEGRFAQVDIGRVLELCQRVEATLKAREAWTVQHGQPPWTKLPDPPPADERPN